MTILKDAGDASKGDQRGRRGGIVGQFHRFSYLLVSENIYYLSSEIGS